VALLAARRNLGFSPQCVLPNTLVAGSPWKLPEAKTTIAQVFALLPNGPCFSTEQSLRMEKPRGG
jgi:hypothetical protein